MRNDIKTLYVDFDGTLVATIDAIVDLPEDVLPNTQYTVCIIITLPFLAYDRKI